MPPRIPRSLLNPLRENPQPISSSRPSIRPFTCSSCRAQQRDSQPSTPDALSQLDTQPSRETPTPQRRLPRWAAVPDAARAPFSLKKPLPNNRYNVNESPQRLDKAYLDVFGDGGDSLLTEDVKWLAVTHKSFDQGRRGYNDRLAFLGKRIVDLQTSLALLAQPTESGSVTGEMADEKQRDGYGREVFRHPAMDILPKLTRDIRSEYSRQARLAELAREFGLSAVVRWKPRSAQELVKSGQNFVLAQALYAMVGALALQRGGDVAVKAVRARLLPRLGLKV